MPDISLSLLPHHALEDAVAWHNGAPVSARQFLSDVEHLIERLPSQPYVLNLCEDRYHFLVGFVATLLADRVSLLPPNRTHATLVQLKERYIDVSCLGDTDEIPAGLSVTRVYSGTTGKTIDKIPSVPASRTAAILFTSGTTGRSQPHTKTWSSLVHVAHVTASRFACSAAERIMVLATVPPQHMFGLETSIMFPLQNGGVIHGGRPFFPGDILAALTACSSQPILVTTPVHMRACIEAKLQFPAPRFVLSATAALSRPLAAAAEEAFGARVYEIYGCTEAGTIATRRTVIDDAWKLIDGLHVQMQGDDGIVNGHHLSCSVVLSDYVESGADGQLLLKGRKADLVNIAGKRMSLADLNQKLLEIEGVVDGVFVVPEESDTMVARPVALVVAPQLTDKQVMEELRKRLDPLFLPRPLYLVDRLPRNTVGKLAREELNRIVAQCEKAALGSAA